MGIRFDDIGHRLKAFRLGSNYSAEEIAARIGISRAALYRYEKGEVAKVETLERVAELLGVSVPTLLGVGVEYIPTAVAFFERMRQIEATAEHITVLFGPISYLLTSDPFDLTLRDVLLESIPANVENRTTTLATVDELMAILRERKRTYRQRRPSIVSLIVAGEMERFLRNGLVGSTDLPDSVLRVRRKSARDEAERIATLMDQQPIGIQVGVVVDTVPNTSFQIFRQPERSVLGISPFRLGEQPNIRIGVAMITSAPDALRLHEDIAQDMWRRALKGPDAAAFVRGLVERCRG